MSQAPSQVLRTRAWSGLGWVYGSFLSGRLLFFVATLVLVRLLAPEEFGLFAFVLAIVAFAENVTDLGVGAALVYRRDAHDPRVASTAFWIGIAGALVLIGAAWGAAPLVAGAGPGEGVALILQVLSLQFLFSALGNTQLHLVQHDLEFRRLFGPELASGLVKGAVAVVMAVTGFGVWSLVGGQLSGALVRAAGLWWVTGWRPKLVCVPREARSLLAYGAGISAVGLLGEAIRSIDYLIVGARLGATALGFYLLAFRLPELLILSVFKAGWRVLFPFYSRLRDLHDPSEPLRDLEELARGYLGTVRVAALVAFPAGLGVSVLALPLVLTLYGGRWEPSAAPMAFVGIWAALSAVTGMPGTVFKAVGRTGLMTAVAVVYLAVLAPVLWLAAGRGIAWVAAGHVAVQVVYLLALSLVVARVLPVSWRDTLAQTAPGLLASLGMAGALFPLGVFLPPAAALAAGIPAGPIVYLALLTIISRPDVEALLAVIRSRRDRAGRLAVERV